MQKLTREQIRSIYDAGPEAVISLTEQLIEANEMLVQQVILLQTRVNELEQQIAQNSRNSHKPPSSDGLKKQTRSLRKRSKRKAGGQKGHKGQTLKQVAKPDKTVKCFVTQCKACEKALVNTKVKRYEKRQVFDIPPVSLQVTEYQAEIKDCPHCQTTNKASFPQGVTQPTQYGSGIKERAVYLMNQHLLPYERTTEIIADFYGRKISAGTLYHFNQVCFEALKEPVEKIKEQIIASDVVNFDESGLRAAKRLKWLHSASTPTFTLYMFHQKRGSVAMDEANILPQFKGTAIHDHLKSYFKYDNCRHGLCNTHHLREFTFIFECEKQQWAKQMNDLLLEIKQSVDQAKMNGHTHLARSQIEGFERRYEIILDEGFHLNPDRDPKRKRKKRTKAQNLLIRLRDFREPTLAFMNDFSVPFDNNLAERDIRMIKVKQKISGCFRKDLGAEMFCRIRSYISTAKKQGRNISHVLQSAVDVGSPVDLSQTAE